MIFSDKATNNQIKKSNQTITKLMARLQSYFLLIFIFLSW